MEIILLFVGAIFAAVGGFILYDRAQFIKSANLSKGSVVGVRTKTGSKGTAMYAPVIGYVQDGVEYQFSSNTYSSVLTLSIGDEVDILVSSNDPGDARLRNSPDKVLGGIFLALGAGCSIAFFFLFEINAFSLGMAAFITFALVFQFVASLRRNHIYSLDDLKKAIGEVRKGNAGQAFGKRVKGNRGSSNAVEDGGERIITDPAALKIHKEKSKAPAWVGVVFFLVGIGVLVGGGVLAQSRQEFLEQALPADGVVISLESRTTSSSSGGSSTVYYPVVKYSPSGAGAVEFTHDTGSNPPSYSRGERVKVLYSADNHRDAIIDEGWANWLGPIIMLALGAVFTFVGFLVVKRHWAGKREKQTGRLRLDI